ncbi:MAG: hypothetical protein OHK0053_07630 [Microscillaceae bacterium]
MTHRRCCLFFLRQKFKKGGLWLGFWLLSLGLLWGQSYENLVPNPSFEQYSRCPSFLGAVRSYNVNSSYGLVNDWVANPPDCTPDYYHVCGKKGLGLPKNLTGFQAPLEGEAYIGMIMRIGEVSVGPLSDLFYREHVTTRLVRPLQKNYQYRVSFWVSLSEYSRYALDGLGALLTETPVIIRENESFTPQIVNQGGYLLETEAWVEIADTLVAQGGEQYLTLGNFDSFRQKRLKKLAPQPAWRKKFNYYRAYYYLDLVKVEEMGPAPPTLSPLPPLITHFGEIVPGKAIILKNVHFEFDKAELLPESFPELQDLAHLLHQQPDWHIKILGHTDSIGTEAKNLDLSQRRAEAVVNYLQALGIRPARLQALGQGETQPLRPNNTPENRQLNRRVEFILQAPQK